LDREVQTCGKRQRPRASPGAAQELGEFDSGQHARVDDLAVRLHQAAPSASVQRSNSASLKHLQWPRRLSILSGEAILRIPGWYLVLAGVTLWGCRSPAPAAASSQSKEPQQVNQTRRGSTRSTGVAIRLAAQGGVPRLYRLPRLVELPGVLRGRLPPLERVIGLDAESEFLFVATAKQELLALDLGSGRVDTVAKEIA